MGESPIQPETTNQQPPVAGLLAEFPSPEAVKEAAAAVCDEDFTRFDVHSPFPIHGVERAMGIRPTILPWIVLGAGVAGLVVALLLQWWTNAVDYPLNISGKPFFSLPANIPVTFELIVLFSALAAFGSAIVLNLLPRYSQPVFTSDAFRRATTDGFFLSIEAADPKFDMESTRTLLESLGATRVEVLDEITEGRQFPRPLFWAGAVVTVLALLPPLLIAWHRSAPKRSPRLHLIHDMDNQPKYKTQKYSALFADHRTMRPAILGTVSQRKPITVDGQRVDDQPQFYTGKIDDQWADAFPMPVTESIMRRGQERFNIYCATCHGLDGGGRGMTALRALKREEPKWVPPLSLYSSGVLAQPVGQIFGTISHGIRSMPSYGSQIPEEDRWAIVAYVRALQRSQHAEESDVPEEIRPKLRGQ